MVIGHKIIKKTKTIQKSDAEGLCIKGFTVATMWGVRALSGR